MILKFLISCCFLKLALASDAKSREIIADENSDKSEENDSTGPILDNFVAMVRSDPGKLISEGKCKCYFFKFKKTAKFSLNKTDRATVVWNNEFWTFELYKLCWCPSRHK